MRKKKKRKRTLTPACGSKSVLLFGPFSVLPHAIAIAKTVEKDLAKWHLFYIIPRIFTLRKRVSSLATFHVFADPINTDQATFYGGLTEDNYHEEMNYNDLLKTHLFH